MKKYTIEGICDACDGHGFIDLHHIKTRGAGGSDDKENLLSLCRIHHSEIHAYGLIKFIDKHPIIESILISKGWKFDDFCQKWLLLTKDGWSEEL